MEISNELEQLRTENAVLIKLLMGQERFQLPYTAKGKEVMFVDFYKQWLEHKKPELQPSTYFEYTRIYQNYVLPYFKSQGKLMEEITPEDVAGYYRHLKNSYGMTNNSVIRHHANMYTCFKYAYAEGYLPYMLMDRVQRPKEEKQQDFNYYALDELLELFTMAKGSNIYTPILLAAILGLRRSELLALKWDAINFHTGAVTIKRKMTRDKTKKRDTVSRNLKSEASQRTLVLPSSLLLHLELVKEGSRTLPSWEHAEFVCVDSNGKLPTLNMITNRFRDFLQQNGLKKIHLHDLRHSCATLLLSWGYSMKDIQEWLGHSNYNTTANIYTHVGMEEKQKIASQLNNLLAAIISNENQKTKWRNDK